MTPWEIDAMFIIRGWDKEGSMDILQKLCNCYSIAMLHVQSGSDNPEDPWDVPKTLAEMIRHQSGKVLGVDEGSPAHVEVVNTGGPLHVSCNCPLCKRDRENDCPWCEHNRMQGSICPCGKGRLL